MEHKELDKLFRDMIQNDNSELNAEESKAKKSIWKQLDLHNNKRKYNYWKLVSALLLLLWILSFCFGNNYFKKQGAINAQLLEQNQVFQKEISTLQNRLAEINQDKSFNTNTNKVQKNNVPAFIDKNNEKIIYRRDTLWLEKPVFQEQVQIIRDTILVKTEIPIATTTIKNTQKLPSSKNNKKQTPSKIEFVFGKKPIKNAKKKSELFILDSGVAKKTKNKKDGTTIIPINKIQK